jgi:hypothetical protein
MDAGSNYLIYSSPTTPQQETGAAGGTKTYPLTAGTWQKEMLDFARLYDNKAATFTSSLGGEKTAIDTGKPAAETGAVKDAGLQKTYTRPACVEVAIDPSEAVSREEEARAIESRNGEVLKQGMILKADHFPDIHQLNPKDPHVEGAPNYRKVEGEPIHGTSQPTVEGIKNVLKEAGADPASGAGKKAVWTDLREEPVVYVNGQPFNMRSSDKPYSNLDQSGMSAKDIEKQEEQLKKEILAEAAKNGGYIVVQEEVKEWSQETGKLECKTVPRKIKVDQESVKTTKDVFDGLKKEGYNVDFARVPVTDEKSPEPRDFDAIRERVEANPGGEFIFNCHQGKGRTTTAMVVASLIHQSKDKTKAGQDILKNKALREDIKEVGNHNTSQYRQILKTIKGLAGGLKSSESKSKSKEEADAVIDREADLQNLRTTVEDAAKKAESATDVKKKAEYEARARDYQERYQLIIDFNEYLKEQSPGFKVSFEDWQKNKPEKNADAGSNKAAAA